jgi:hypothetical protein
MPVDLQSDFVVNEFWKSVTARLRDELTARRLGKWKVILRPKTKADEDFTKDPGRYNLTPAEARRLEAQCSTDIDEANRVCTFSFSDGEQWFDADGHPLSATGLAMELADMLQCLVED